MRKIPGHAGKLTAAAFASLVLTGVATAQTADTIINQDISGFSLPGVQMPQGADEVRASDGTSCRSAVGGSGAYLDVGLIGNPTNSVKNNSYYGRVVVPLGRNPKRLDCSKLYELEVERLRMELELAKAGLGRTTDPEIDQSQTSALDAAPQDDVTIDEEEPVKPKKSKKKAQKVSGDWDDEGWSTDGRKKKN